MLDLRKLSFGGSAAIVTSMGLIVGLDAATAAKATVVTSLYRAAENHQPTRQGRFLLGFDNPSSQTGDLTSAAVDFSAICRRSGRTAEATCRA